MEHVVDLYVKLLIGTFSFIGPSFTLFISIFLPAINRARKRHTEQLDTVQRVLKTVVSSSSTNIGKEIKRQILELEKLEKVNKKELDLLKPKRQIKRLFASLFSAIVLVGVYQNFEKCEIILVKRYIFVSLVLSLAAFCYAIYVLWQIFCNVLKIKEEEFQIEETKKADKASQAGELVIDNK